MTAKMPAYVPDNWITKAGNLKGMAPTMAWKPDAKLVHLTDEEGNALCGARIPMGEPVKKLGEQRPYLCKACRNAYEAANAESSDGEEGEAADAEPDPEATSDDTSGDPSVTTEDGQTAAPSAMLGCNADDGGKQCQAAYSTIIKDKRFPGGEARLCPKHFKLYQADPESVKPAE